MSDWLEPARLIGAYQASIFLPIQVVKEPV